MADKKTPTAAKTESKPPKVEPKPTYNPTDWRDPDASFAPDDDSLEAQMWRLGQNTPTTGR